MRWKYRRRKLNQRETARRTEDFNPNPPTSFHNWFNRVLFFREKTSLLGRDETPNCYSIAIHNVRRKLFADHFPEYVSLHNWHTFGNCFSTVSAKLLYRLRVTKAARKQHCFKLCLRHSATRTLHAQFDRLVPPSWTFDLFDSSRD